MQQRQQIELLLNKNYRVIDIAKLLNVSLSTVYLELQRGNLDGKYNANFANQKSLLARKKHGKDCKLTLDLNLAQYLSKLILEDHLSIIQICKKCKEENINCLSRTTIYRAIDNNLIPNVTRDNLKSNATTMFSSGLIQIPKYIREKLDLNDKDILNIILDGEKIILSKYNPDK